MAHCFLILLNIGTSYFSDILVAQYKSIYIGYLAESSPTQEIAFRDGPFDIQGGGAGLGFFLVTGYFFSHFPQQVIFFQK